MKIRIEWLEDEFDCEICDWTISCGARVCFDGELVIDMTPVASCTKSVNYTDADVWMAILKKLGHDVEIKEYSND